MKYFIIETDKKMINQPQIVDWYNKINEKDVHPHSYNKIPKRNMFMVKAKEPVEFADVVSFPFFLVSETIKEVLSLYEPNMVYKTVVFLNPKKEIHFVYNLPTLDEIDCLSSESTFNMDRSIITHPVINCKKLKDKALFYIGNISSRYVVARMDFVESILKKNVKGIMLREVELINEE